MIDVPSCMIDTVCLSSKSLPTLKRTREGLISAVNPLMDLKIRSLSERLPTARMGTQKLSDAIVFLNMIVEPAFSREHLVTAIDRANILDSLFHPVYGTVHLSYGT